MRPAASAVGVAALGVALLAVAVVAWRTRSVPAPPPPARADDGTNLARAADPIAPPAPAPIVAAPPAPVVPPAAGTMAGASEATLMATLRDIGGTAPQRSIALAREGQRRFPNSADAPERAFIIVQSLVNLRRFHEAQDEAREMVRKYPDNQFAQDAQRHLLVYPLDQPSREAKMKEDEMQQRDR